MQQKPTYINITIKYTRQFLSTETTNYLIYRNIYYILNIERTTRSAKMLWGQKGSVGRSVEHECGNLCVRIN